MDSGGCRLCRPNLGDFSRDPQDATKTRRCLTLWFADCGQIPANVDQNWASLMCCGRFWPGRGDLKACSSARALSAPVRSQSARLHPCAPPQGMGLERQRPGGRPGCGDRGGRAVPPSAAREALLEDRRSGGHREPAGGSAPAAPRGSLGCPKPRAARRISCRIQRSGLMG